MQIMQLDRVLIAGQGSARRRSWIWQDGENGMQGEAGKVGELAWGLTKLVGVNVGFKLV
jgi:hypothetical protein